MYMVYLHVNCTINIHCICSGLHMCWFMASSDCKVPSAFCTYIYTYMYRYTMHVILNMWWSWAARTAQWVPHWWMWTLHALTLSSLSISRWWRLLKMGGRSWGLGDWTLLTWLGARGSRRLDPLVGKGWAWTCRKGKFNLLPWKIRSLIFNNPS